MARGQRRVWILCEDRRTERFLSRLCERYGVEVIDVKPAPSGKGAASAWVRRKYAEYVRKRRSKNFQANLGLLVAIDGDNLGVKARMSELEAELRAAGIEPRGDAESIAIFVPTWSIETWLAHLHGAAGIDEDRALKDDPMLRALWRDGPAEAATCKAAALAWSDTPDPPPSLRSAHDEAPRVGLGTRP